MVARKRNLVLHKQKDRFISNTETQAINNPPVVYNFLYHVGFEATFVLV